MLPKGDPYSLARAFEGRTFGGYRIARAIATGGMATVFLARRTGPGRFAQTAALKVIHPHLAKEREFVEMFLEEARIASSINHPNVCRVLDFGQAEGTFYLAMEYVRGETWATALERLTAQRESRVRIHALSTYVIAQACEGLHAVHEAVDPNGLPLQIVHRDISPQNLFIAYDGSVRVLDFGIASAATGANGAQGVSTTQVIKGRYAYMAPEQARGIDVDHRADIWSLGVCLREALSGERLFERDTQLATIMAVTKEDLPPWPKQVPLLLREICDRALEREPAQRYQTARDLGSALARFSASEAEPAGGAEVGRWMRMLFPEQIAQKRAELRELAGAGDEPNTGTFTSIVPMAATRAAAVEPQPTPPRGNPGLRKFGRRAGSWVAAGVLSVGAAYVAFRLTPQMMAGHDAAPPAAVKAELREGPAPTLVPEGPVAAPAMARAPEGTGVGSAKPVEPAPPSTMLAALTAAAAGKPETNGSTRDASKSEEEGEEKGHHHRRRSREEGTEASAPSAGKIPEAEQKTASKTPAATDAAKPAETAAANSGPGTLLVAAASGWAEVSLDGKALGTTPFRVSIPAGSHRLDVRFFGTGSPQPMTVDVQPGIVTKLRLTQ